MNLPIDDQLVRALIAAQFPQFADAQAFPIMPVAKQGHDNRSFRLGETLVVRLPSHAAYAPAIARECEWLPKLAAQLSQPIPVPIAQGQPSTLFPFAWSISKWVPGDVARPARISDLNQFAIDLAEFLQSLQRVSTAGAPLAGEHSFYRGAPLRHYDKEFREAVSLLSGQSSGTPLGETQFGQKFNDVRALTIWQQAIDSDCTQFVWLHGDISVGNLLVQQGKLCGVIDFGQCCVGDSACDYAIAWTLLDAVTAQANFRKILQIDDTSWLRGCAWALWKACITAASRLQNDDRHSDAWEAQQCWTIIARICAEAELR
jgi:aminoglycoside phosphotransferase (APT) family kinase protein